MLPAPRHPLASTVPPARPPSPGAGAVPWPPPPPPCPATPRGPSSPPGLRAGFGGRGWSRPSAAIWKPHDAVATAHGASLRLSRGQGGRPPPPARGRGGGCEMKGETLKKSSLKPGLAAFFPSLLYSGNKGKGKPGCRGTGFFFLAFFFFRPLPTNHFSCSCSQPRSPAAPERGTAGCRGPSQRRPSSRLLISCWN